MSGAVRGKVVAAMSGDSCIIRFREDKVVKYMVIITPFARAPRPWMLADNGIGEPFAVEALEVFRCMVDQKRVMVTGMVPDKNGRMFDNQFLGQLPVATGRIFLVDSMDVYPEKQMLEHGMARFERIESGDESLLNYGKRCEEAEKSAKAGKKGVWRAEEQEKDRSGCILEGEFTTTIVSVNPDCSFSLLDPRVDVELAGVTWRKEAVFGEYGECILFHSVRVKVLKQPRLVAMTIDGRDVAETLMALDIAVVNPLTAHFLEDRKRMKARPMSLGGVVVAIPRSGSLELDTICGRVTVDLECLVTPTFTFKDGGPGWASWRALRDAVLGREVMVTVAHWYHNDHAIGQVVVQGVNVNEMLLREGFAKLGVSQVLPRPNNISDIEHAAKIARKTGGEAETNTVAEILAPTELLIWKKEGLVNVKLLHLEEVMSHYYVRCQAMKLLEDIVLHRDVDIVNDGVIVERRTKTDIRESLLTRGFVKHVNGLEAKLDKAASRARSSKIGIWCREHAVPNVSKDDVCVITNVVSPTEIFIQFHSKELKLIEETIRTCELHPLISPEGCMYCMYVVRVNGARYRAVVVDRRRYYLVDYGFTVDSFICDVFLCPVELVSRPVQAMFVSLAYVKSFENQRIDKATVNYLWNISGNRNRFHATIVSNAMTPSVLLQVAPSEETLQSVMLRDGAVLFDGASDTDAQRLKEMLEAESAARSQNIGGWTPAAH